MEELWHEDFGSSSLACNNADTRHSVFPLLVKLVLTNKLIGFSVPTKGTSRKIEYILKRTEQDGLKEQARTTVLDCWSVRYDPGFSHFAQLPQ